MSGLDFTPSEEQAMVVETAHRLLRTLEPRRDQHLRMIYEEQRFPKRCGKRWPKRDCSAR